MIMERNKNCRENRLKIKDFALNEIEFGIIHFAPITRFLLRLGTLSL